MNRRINLTEISKGKLYQVIGFDQVENSYSDKLIKMGFVGGTPIALAPVNISDPIVVQIRGSRIALRKKEAQHIFVEELHNA